MGHNIGSTSLSIALSNFLCNKYMESTAYVELNSTREIQNIGGHSDNKVIHKVGIDFYPAVTLVNLSNILQLNYHNLIIDFGLLNIYTYPEFKRCTHRLAIASASPWKKSQLDQFLLELSQNNINVKEDIKLLGNLGTKKIKPFHQTIPFISNPFQLTSEYFGFFEEILERK